MSPRLLRNASRRTALGLGAALTVAALAAPAMAADPVKVGFVYVGPIGDHG